MRRSALRLLWGPQLMLTLLPGLLAPKGCYFGAEKVPLGGHFAKAGAAPTATEECGGASGTDGGGLGADGGALSAGYDGVGSNSNPGVGGMGTPGVFQTH